MRAIKYLRPARIGCTTPRAADNTGQRWRSWFCPVFRPVWHCLIRGYGRKRGHVYADRHSLLHLFHSGEFLGELVSAAVPKRRTVRVRWSKTERCSPDRNTDRSPERWSAQEWSTAGLWKRLDRHKHRGNRSLMVHRNALPRNQVRGVAPRSPPASAERTENRGVFACFELRWAAAWSWTASRSSAGRTRLWCVKEKSR